MYNYDFKKEPILFEKNECFIKFNEKEVFVNIIITDKNLLLFYDLNKAFVNMKSSGIFVSPNYELIKKYNLEKLNYEVDNKNTHLSENIILYDFDINKIIESDK